MPAKLTAIYQLKIVLQGSKPPIWRRIQVKSDITLDVLHQIIQTAMGWTDSHLHQFYIRGNFYSSRAFHLDETEDESRIKLNFLAALNDKNHPEHAESLEQLEWLGGDFDPEEFDLAEINEGLADLD